MTLFHGCTEGDLEKIFANGINPTVGRANTDFGRGFYTTPVYDQAVYWAFHREDFLAAPGTARVIELVVEREALARLHSLFFVSGDDREEDYWSFVSHCRQSPLNSQGTTVRNHIYRVDVASWNGWFDVVAGPIAWDWKQRRVDSRYSQVSFHTVRAAKMLNRVLGTRGKTTAWIVTNEVRPV